MKQHSEFVIIGGGVLGASLAYQLSLHGREVLLLEQNEICSGTSSGTVAWIGPFDRQPLFMEELAIRSFLRLFLLNIRLPMPIADYSRRRFHLHLTILRQDTDSYNREIPLYREKLRQNEYRLHIPVHVQIHWYL